jgi:hypothetical protein
MVAVDYWPQEEGYIVEGEPVMMCTATAAIGEMSCVKLDTCVAGCVKVTATAAAADSVGVALRSASGAGSMVPVAFRGVVKMLAGAAFALGAPVTSNGAALPDTASVIIAGTSQAILLGTGGADRILGTALHAGTNIGDEVLVLLGRW